MSRLEREEQKDTGQMLDLWKVLWFHSPNEKPVAANEDGSTKRRGGYWVGQGQKAGIPDIMILSWPPRWVLQVDRDPRWDFGPTVAGTGVPVSARGCAIELKRRDVAGHSWLDHERRLHASVVTENQRWWLQQLRRHQWATGVCYGSDEAREFLEMLGYQHWRLAA